MRLPRGWGQAAGLLAACVLLLAPALAHPGADPLDPSPFRWRSRVAIDAAGWVRIPLPDDVLDGARADLADLRAVDAEGREVPYVLLRGEDAAVPDPVPLRVAPERRDPDEGGAWIVDASPVVALGGISALRLQIEGHPFVRRARVDASADRVHWRPVSAPTTLYSVDAGGERARLATVEVEEHGLPWLRIWVDDPSGGELSVVGASGVPLPRGAVPSRWIELLTPGAAAGGVDESHYALELPAAHLPIDRIRVFADDELYSRAASVEELVLAEGRLSARSLGRGRLARLRVGRMDVELGEIEVGRPEGRALRLRVRDGDDRPLGIAAVQARRLGRVLLLDARAAGELTLLYGDAKRRAPSYDLEAARDELGRQSVPQVEPGPRGPNPDHVPREPVPEAPTLAAPLDLRRWGASRSLWRPPGATWVRWDLDAAVLAGARGDLGDLRIVLGDRQVPYVLEEAPGEARLPLAPEPRQGDEGARTSRWRLPLPVAGIPVRELRLWTAAPLFQRTVRVLDDAPAAPPGRGPQAPRLRGGAEWTRRPGDGADRPLRVPLQGTSGGGLVVEVDDGDNLPIEIDRAEALYPLFRLHAKVPPEGELRLLHGNPDAVAPRYDLSLLAAEVLGADEAVGRLGDDGGRGAGGGGPWGARFGGAERWFFGAAVLCLAALLALLGLKLARGVPTGG